MPVQCRVAPSLGALEGHPNDVWGTTYYTNTDMDTVFFGLYGLPDFYQLWRTTGKKWILWAGSDIRHFVNGYFLEDSGGIKLDNKALAQWINTHCESWVENDVERYALADVGIDANVCPSFMGNVDDYKVSYQPNGKYYASVSGNDFKLYGWHKIEMMALKHPNLEFHLYGNTIEWPTKNKNVIIHGRVPKDIMNNSIKKMQGGLRLVEFDGFSEILAKSILWGQYPISIISYPFIDDRYISHHSPNIEGRNYYLETLNKYPWNAKIN